MADEGAGYRGRWKKWLAIYAAIAVVLYLVIYFVFIRDSGGSGGGGGGYFVLALPYLLRPRTRRR